jgi:hypothetical protein
MSLCRLEDSVIGLVLFDVGGVLIDLYSKDKETEAVLEREYGLDPASYERIAKPAMERAVIGKIGTLIFCRRSVQRANAMSRSKR